MFGKSFIADVAYLQQFFSFQTNTVFASNICIVEYGNLILIYYAKIWLNVSFNPRPAGVFGRTPQLGGGADSAPCLTPEQMVVERRKKTANESSQQVES